MFWLEKNGKLVLNVRLTPSASSRRVGGLFVDADGVSFLKISVVAVPEKGKANKELIAYLSSLLKLPKSAFNIIYGETDRYKKIEIDADVSDTLKNTLNSLGD